MSFKRFSKFLLVVLALALWAGTAYSQPYLVPNPNSVTLTYTQYGGAQAGASKSVTVSAVDTGSYSVGWNSGQTLPGWLSLTCDGNTVDGTASTTVNCTFSVNTSGADSLASQAAANSPYTFTFQSGAGADATVSVALALTLAPAPALTPAGDVTLSNYTQGQSAAVSTTTTFTTNTDNLSFTASSSAGWLTVSPSSGTAHTASATTLTLTVNDTAADALTPGAQTATVTLTGGTSPATFTVGLTVLGPTTLSASPNSLAFTYVKSSGTAPAAQTMTLTDTNATDTYTWNSPPAWLSIASANGGASGAIATTHDTLTYSIVTGQADSLSVGPHSFTVQLAATNQQALSVTVTLNVQTPSTITATPNSLTFATSYTKGGTAPAAVTTVVADSNSTGNDTYSIASLATTAPWLTCTPTNSSIGKTNPSDTLTCSVNTAAADKVSAGTQTATVHIQVASQPDVTFTVSLTVAATVSPLSSSVSPVVLKFVKGPSAVQNAEASVTTGVSSTISSTNTAYEPYTANVPALPSWLSVTCTNSQASIGHTDTCVFKVLVAGVPSTTGTTTFNVHLAVTGNAAEPDLLIPVNLVTTSSPLQATTPSASLNYIKGGGTGTLTTSVQISVASGTQAFTLNVATLPPWLTATNGSGQAFTSGTANTTGVTVNFNVVTAVAATMSTGNYTANVGFSATGYSDLVVTISFLISNTAPGLNLFETSAEKDIVWGEGTPIPTPTWTPYSTNEPIPFTATCTVTESDSGWVTDGSAYPCELNVAAALAANPPQTPTNVVTGVAYTWGYGITATLDTGLFASTLGNWVKVTVTVQQQGGGTISKTYKYTLQPLDPKITGISPTSAAVIAANTSLVVLVKGTGFVGPNNISGTSIVPTQVWLGTSTTPLSSGYVVVSATQMLVTIPQTAFAAYATIATGKSSANLAIGIANQTGVNAPTTPVSTWNLNVTTLPVIYSITSTATFTQPALGKNPIVAPYELISIFGDNFGLANLTPPYITATADSYNRIPTSLTLSGSGKTAVNLTVTFKDAATGKTSLAAPILFANQNQINVAVPSAVVAGANYNVTVTSGATTNVSDSYQVTAIVADPGIFTLASDGYGQGAIINVKDGSVNQPGNGASVGDLVSIYMTGLGAPESTAVDTTGNPQTAPTGCIAVSGTKTLPGYLQVVNTAGTGYTSPAWTTLDGAVMTYGSHAIISGLPPCMTDAITVTFGTGSSAITATTLTGGGINYAGWVPSAIAGLYQINVTIPTGVPSGKIPITVTIPPYTSPANVVTMTVK